MLHRDMAVSLRTGRLQSSGNEVSSSEKQEIMKPVQYYVGVDGGGSGTRALLADATGKVLGAGAAGPSGLAHGVERAWEAILSAISQAYQAHQAYTGSALDALAYDQVALYCGLAGANHAPWAQAFHTQQPGFAELSLVSDALTTLYGAFQGEAGVIVALGTGSVGLALDAEGERHEVGGWGFPSGDEASGAWLGLRALNHAQQVADGRIAEDALALAVLAFCGGSRQTLMRWGVQANQTAVAQLAPLVVQYAGQVEVATRLMQQAGREVEAMALALDPKQQLPVALCGGLASAVMPYLPASLRPRLMAPKGDAVTGALWMARLMAKRSTQDKPPGALASAEGAQHG